MNWVSGIIVFLLIWWTTLFAVLPWGNRPEEQPDKGHVTSAPANPRLKQKFLVTTVISVILWLLVYVLIEIGIIDFYTIARQMSESSK